MSKVVKYVILPVAAALVVTQGIIGVFDWRPIRLLPTNHQFRIWAQSTAEIQIDGQRCTAWVYTDGQVLTNDHCLPQRATPRSVSIRYTGETRYTRCEGKALARDAELDYALVTCPTKNKKAPSFYTDPVPVGTNIVHIQMNCNYDEAIGGNENCKPEAVYDAGPNAKIRSREQFGINLPDFQLITTTDILGGSSGSNIMLRDDSLGPGTAGKVIGLMNLAYNETGHPSGSQNVGVLSVGTKIHRVCEDLRAKGFEREGDTEINAESPDDLTVIEIVVEIAKLVMHLLTKLEA